MITVSKSELLKKLPEFKDQWVTVKGKQKVPDIIDGIFDSHKRFRKYYDQIGFLFQGATLSDTCENPFNFCKENIRYVEESEESQSTALPTGILVRGYGDCKHYASFIAGCLDSIERLTGNVIDWEYCFASYKEDQPVPYHVFVIVRDEAGEIWVDPTPGAEDKTPCWWIRKKVE